MRFRLTALYAAAATVLLIAFAGMHILSERDLRMCEETALAQEAACIETLHQCVNETIDQVEQCIEQYGEENVRQCLNVCRPAR